MLTESTSGAACWHDSSPSPGIQHTLEAQLCRLRCCHCHCHCHGHCRCQCCCLCCCTPWPASLPHQREDNSNGVRAPHTHGWQSMQQSECSTHSLCSWMRALRFLAALGSTLAAYVVPSCSDRATCTLHTCAWPAQPAAGQHRRSVEAKRPRGRHTAAGVMHAAGSSGCSGVGLEASDCRLSSPLPLDARCGSSCSQFIHNLLLACSVLLSLGLPWTCCPAHALSTAH